MPALRVIILVPNWSSSTVPNWLASSSITVPQWLASISFLSKWISFVPNWLAAHERAGICRLSDEDECLSHTSCLKKKINMI